MPTKLQPKEQARVYSPPKKRRQRYKKYVFLEINFYVPGYELMNHIITKVILKKHIEPIFLGGGCSCNALTQLALQIYTHKMKNIALLIYLFYCQNFTHYISPSKCLGISLRLNSYNCSTSSDMSCTLCTPFLPLLETLLFVILTFFNTYKDAVEFSDMVILKIHIYVSIYNIIYIYIYI